MLRRFLPLLILVVAVAVSALLVLNKAAPQRKVVEPVPLLVDVIDMARAPVQFKVSGSGEVKSLRTTMISAQVAGRIIDVAPSVLARTFFKSDEPLLKIDPADYETDVKLAQAELARARAALDEELARGKVAAEEWRLVSSDKRPELGLRKPQLDREQANVAAAKANLERAQRNLQRTNVVAPFDGIVTAKKVALGQFVPVSSPLVEVMDTSVAEVRIPLSESEATFIADSLLKVIERPKTEKPVAILSTRQAHMANNQWIGYVDRIEPVMDANSRVMTAVVRVEDPYQQKTPLHFGRFVDVVIEGRRADNIIRLPRYTLRLDGTILTVDENQRLVINAVNVLRTDEQYVYIDEGLSTSHKAVVSSVPTPYTGMPVRYVDNQGTMVAPQVEPKDEQR